MADISDALTGMAQAIAAGLYPNGTSQPSVTGIPTRVYPGWPDKAALDQDLANGYVNVSVYPLPTERVEPLVNLDATVQSVTAAGTVLTVSGNQITVSGTPKVGDVACVNWNKTPFAYAVTSSDTTATVAAALAADIGGTAVGSVMTAPSGTFLLTATVSTPAVAMTPMRRIARQVQVSVWAATPDARDATAKIVDSSLFQAENLTMPDGTLCGVTYASSPVNDFLQKANLYRRDVILTAHFVDTYTFNAQTVADLELNMSAVNVANVTTSVTPVVTMNEGY